MTYNCPICGEPYSECNCIDFHANRFGYEDQGDQLV